MGPLVLDVGDTAHLRSASVYILCTALLPVVDTRPRTIQSLALLVFGVLCFLVTTVCLVSGETSSTLSARDESTANYDVAVELVHKNIK